MKVILKNAGGWQKRGKITGGVVSATLMDDNENVLLEGDWGVLNGGKVLIKSRSKNARLSNFARIGANGFQFDGVYVRGLEGFLQGLKFQDRELQEECCKLTGARAFNFGRGNDEVDGVSRWKQTQTLYWKGKPYPRASSRYTALIERFYDAVYKGVEENRNRLLLSGDLNLSHNDTGTDGSKQKSETVLSAVEFIGNLNRVRSDLIRQLGVQVIWEDGGLDDAVASGTPPAPSASKSRSSTAASKSPASSRGMPALDKKPAPVDTRQAGNMMQAVQYARDEAEDGVLSGLRFNQNSPEIQELVHDMVDELKITPAQALGAIKQVMTGVQESFIEFLSRMV